jgi:hypothetical protein
VGARVEAPIWFERAGFMVEQGATFASDEQGTPRA